MGLRTHSCKAAGPVQLRIDSRHMIILESGGGGPSGSHHLGDSAAQPNLQLLLRLLSAPEEQSRDEPQCLSRTVTVALGLHHLRSSQLPPPTRHA